MLVKVSGASLGNSTRDDFVNVALAPLLALLDDATADDATVAQVLDDASNNYRRPSVECILHAVCISIGQATVVAHTHPVSVNILLCSEHGQKLATDVLFPEQVVVLGPRPLYIPYVDPGLPLARTVRVEMLNYLEQHGDPPRLVYLANHGLFALGNSTSHVLQITEMAVKLSRIYAGVLAVGAIQCLDNNDIERIATRPDEARRRFTMLLPVQERLSGE
jgi:rhamnose utilization protein RhaD (predicted bifunctional aldolase and dehydrogenase)